MGFNDEGLGEAMALSYARDTADAARKSALKTEIRLDDLEQRVADLELENSKLLDACRFLYRWYVDRTQHGNWPFDEGKK